MNWAIEEAEKRNADVKDLAWKTMDSLLLMYESYNRLYNNQNVQKIIEWSEHLYQKYIKYNSIIKELENEMLTTTNIEKENISFKDFIKLIEEKIR